MVTQGGFLEQLHLKHQEEPIPSPSVRHHHQHHHHLPEMGSWEYRALLNRKAQAAACSCHQKLIPINCNYYWD